MDTAWEASTRTTCDPARSAMNSWAWAGMALSWVAITAHEGRVRQAAELDNPAVVRETLRRAVDEVFPTDT